MLLVVDGLILLRVFLGYSHQVSLSLVGWEGTLREGKEPFDLARQVLLLDFLHALLI